MQIWNALGAIEKADLAFRLIHVATHGVRVNQFLRPRDQMQMPGAPEGKALMCVLSEKGPRSSASRGTFRMPIGG